METLTPRRALLVENVEILTGALSATVWRPSPDAELYYVGDPQFAQSAIMWRPSLGAERQWIETHPVGSARHCVKTTRRSPTKIGFVLS
jgi:hypothetical protein